MAWVTSDGGRERADSTTFVRRPPDARGPGFTARPSTRLMGDFRRRISDRRRHLPYRGGWIADDAVAGLPDSQLRAETPLPRRPDPEERAALESDRPDEEAVVVGQPRAPNRLPRV